MRRLSSDVKPDLDDLAMLDGLWRRHPRYAGCLAHWLFTESPVSRLYDISGWNRHGDPSTTMGQTLGQSGLAYLFDGSGDSVSVGTFSPPQQGTICAWVKPLSGIDPNANYYIFRAETGGNELLLRGDTYGSQTFGIRTRAGYGTTLAANSSGHPTDADWQQWYHLAGTWDVDVTGLQLFRNGILEGTDSGTSGTFASNMPTAIGSNEDETAFFWDGPIADIRLYNHVLSAETILSLCTNPYLEFEWAQMQVHQLMFPGASVGAPPVGAVAPGSLALLGVGI